MDEQELEQALSEVLAEAGMTEPDDELTVTVPVELTGIEEVRTYRDAGVLTNNAGLVIRMKGGGEFQLTIVQSR